MVVGAAFMTCLITKCQSMQICTPPGEGGLPKIETSSQCKHEAEQLAYFALMSSVRYCTSNKKSRACPIWHLLGKNEILITD